MRMNLTILSTALLIGAGASTGPFVGNQGIIGKFADGDGQGSLFDPAAKRRPITPRGPLDPWEEKTIEIFKQASPSVVFVTRFSLQQNFWSMDPVEVREGSGSGFVWDDNGYIVTNYHVVGDGDDRTAEWKVAIGDHVWMRTWSGARRTAISRC